MGLELAGIYSRGCPPARCQASSRLIVEWLTPKVRAI
jgi:hypothetical protein